MYVYGACFFMSVVVTVWGSVGMFTLPIFHAITGGDTVYYFASRGNETVWRVASFLEVTDAFE